MRICDWISDVCSSDLKIVQLGGKVLTASDSGGFILDPDGIDLEKIDWIKAHKTHRRERIEEYVEAFPGATFHAGKAQWRVPCDVALLSAPQNELMGARKSGGQGQGVSISEELR